MSTKRQIRLPEDLCAAAERQFGAQFGGLESLVEFVLQELVRSDADATRMDHTQQELLDKRLRDLGYL